jgi:hypothetical protein
MAEWGDEGQSCSTNYYMVMSMVNTNKIRKRGLVYMNEFLYQLSKSFNAYELKNYIDAMKDNVPIIKNDYDKRLYVSCCQQSIEHIVEGQNLLNNGQKRVITVHCEEDPEELEEIPIEFNIKNLLAPIEKPYKYTFPLNYLFLKTHIIATYIDKLWPYAYTHYSEPTSYITALYRLRDASVILKDYMEYKPKKDIQNEVIFDKKIIDLMKSQPQNLIKSSNFEIRIKK